MFDERRANEELTMPVPISLTTEGDFFVLKKGDSHLVAIHSEDDSGINDLLNLFNSLSSAQMSPPEIEQMRDLLYKVTGS